MIPSYVPFIASAWLFLVGLYGVVTSRHLVHLVMCLAVTQTASYLLLVGVGYRANGVAPVMVGTQPGETVCDPIVQALMLTDVVVEATVIALLLAMAVKMFERRKSADPAELLVERG